ncbi:MAG: YwaF family protein [Oscillospiraceae bacterium]|nr:YwaF family protein [Oscillospiraceae bacterium]
MSPQPLFGTFHLTYILIGIAVCFGAAFLLRNFSERSEKRMLFVIGICLFVSEIYKQLFWYYAIGYDEYPWIRLPFHLCSVPMYLLPVLPFLKNGKVKTALYDFLGTYCFAGGLISVVADGGLLREYWMMTVHCLTWHLILVFVGLYLSFRGKISRKFKGFIGATIVYYLFAAAAFSLNCALWNLSNGICDMFFVGPAPMEVVIYRDIAKATGRPVVTLIYLLTITFISLIFWFLLTRKIPRKEKLGVNSYPSAKAKRP